MIGHTYSNGEVEAVILADRTPRIPEGKGLAPIPATKADSRYVNAFEDLSATASGMQVTDVTDRTRDGEVEYESAVDAYVRDVEDELVDDGTFTTERGTFRRTRDGKVVPAARRYVAETDAAENGVRIVSRKGGVTYVRKGSASVQVWQTGYAASAVCRCGYRADAPAPSRPANVEGPETYERASMAMRYVTTVVYAHLIYAH